MSKVENQYLEHLKLIIEKGDLVPNRTGVSAYTYPHLMLTHDMDEGFPLLTTKKMAWKTMKVELEFFIKGLTDKKWLQERGCKIWDEWCNPEKIPSNLNSEDRKIFQKEEMDLGLVYGYQWRNFTSQGHDQLKSTVDTLKKDPYDRRMLCSAWNPNQISKQALPPCHVLWHVFVSGDRLHLCWFQRSCDQFLGIPFNLSSFALLLHLLSLESGIKAGVISGFLSNVHVYENHLEAAREQLKRTPYPLPNIKTNNFKSVFDWTYKDTELENYISHPSIKAEIAV